MPLPPASWDSIPWTLNTFISRIVRDWALASRRRYGWLATTYRRRNGILLWATHGQPRGRIMLVRAAPPIQHLLFHTPLLHLFVFGSESYHDWYRWPVKDKKIYENWLATTTWGKLFANYASGMAPTYLKATLARSISGRLQRSPSESGAQSRNSTLKP